MLVNKKEQMPLDNIDFTISKPKRHDFSQFITLATKVYTVQQIQSAYIKVRQMYPSYDYVMMGCKIDDYMGYQDDGEHTA